MAAIVPRRERRGFAEHRRAAEATFDALAPESVRDSDELYLVSVASAASVKVRGGQADVKQLERVNDDGLEQWRPVLKADFPLVAADAASMLAALGASTGSL